MLGPNLAQLGSGEDYFKEQTEITRGDTAAIQIASRTVEPGFRLGPEIAGTPSLINVSAENYLPAAAQHGDTGYSPAELAAAPAVARRWADSVLALALKMSTTNVLEGYDATAAAGPGCTAVPADGTVPEVALAPGLNRVYVAPGGEASLSHAPLRDDRISGAAGQRPGRGGGRNQGPGRQRAGIPLGPPPRRRPGSRGLRGERLRLSDRA